MVQSGMSLRGGSMILAVLVMLLAAGCETLQGGLEAPPSVSAPSAHVPPAGDGGPVAVGYNEIGYASWYGAAHEGHTTASGQVYDPEALTAAHRTLPFGTRVRVVNLDTGEVADVVINDCGPHVAGRMLDLSRAAARTLGMLEDGVQRVRMEVLELAE